jgi:hypothetical protein
MWPRHSPSASATIAACCATLMRAIAARLAMRACSRRSIWGAGMGAGQPGWGFSGARQQGGALLAMEVGADKGCMSRPEQLAVFFALAWARVTPANAGSPGSPPA